MPTRRIPQRAKTTPIETLHSLLTVQEADTAFTRRPITSFLLKYDELPAWRQDNHFILTRYRPTSNSFFICFQSLFQLHNESVNIHSHLSGAWIFFFTALSLYAFERHPVTAADTIAFLFFFSGAVICLGISATYHAVSNHSPKVRRPLTTCFIQSKLPDQSMGKPDRLPRHRHSHFWKFRPERVLWLLLRANAAKNLLGHGTSGQNVAPQPTSSEQWDVDLYHWHQLRYYIREPKVPVPSLAIVSSRHVCGLRSLRHLPSLAWSVYVWT